VKGGWIKRNIRKCPEDVEEEMYYIIDIKCSIINIIKGEEGIKTITNSVKMDGYKIQILVYKKGLEEITRREVRYGFIIGKKYIENRREYGRFENIGVIDYRDKRLEEKIEEAVEWKDWISREYNKIEIEDIRRRKIEGLMPNMKNEYDMNYYNKKKRIAEEIREITLLWQCGIKQRENAIKNEIYFMDDERMDAMKLGFREGEKKYKIIEKMIKMNRGEKKIEIDRRNNRNGWQEEDKYEYYVDFETYNKEGEMKLYMIGVIYKDNYKVYIKEKEGEKIEMERREEGMKIEIIGCKDEGEIIRRFERYIRSNKREEETSVYHWSGCEPRIYEREREKIGIEGKIRWKDMLEIFKDEKYPIIVKNMYNFSLKSIAKKLNEYGMIEIRWEEIEDGLMSSFMAHDYYEEEKKGINFESIIRYNMKDCKALKEILRCIRENK
jgi:hypothetical protein